MIMNKMPNYRQKQKAEIGKAEDRGRRSDGREQAGSCPQLDAD